MSKSIILPPFLLLTVACATELPSPSESTHGEENSADPADKLSGVSGATDPAGADSADGDPNTNTPGGDGDSTNMPGGDGDALGLGDGDALPVDSGPTVDPRGTRYCEAEVLHLGEIHLFNNEWTDEAADTCVFLDTDGTFGFDWTRGNTGAGANPSYPNYPEAEFGINPWNASGTDKSSTTLLPLQLKDFTSASMTLDVTTTTEVNSGWNLAFELWLSDTDPTLGPAKPRGEIMIFLGNEPNYWPHSPSGGQFNDGHNTFTLYESSDTWGDWGIYRQWRLADTDGRVDFNGTVDIFAFLKHHLENEGWDPNLWVTRFEIGNETFQNSGGETRFRSLSFEVNGETRSAQTQ